MYSSLRPSSRTCLRRRARPLRPHLLGLADPAGQVGRLDPLAAVDRQCQPRRLVDQLALDGVPRLHVADPLLGALFELFGVFLGQDGHDRAGGHAMLE